MAPGIRSSRAVVPTRVCSAAWSIRLSPDSLSAEPGRGVALVTDGVVGVDAACVDGVGRVEHAGQESNNHEKARTADAPELTSRSRLSDECPHVVSPCFWFEGAAKGFAECLVSLSEPVNTGPAFTAAPSGQGCAGGGEYTHSLIMRVLISHWVRCAWSSSFAP